MNDKYCDFDEDLKFSQNPAFKKAYNSFYLDYNFRETYLASFYKSKVPTVDKIIRSEDILLQQGVGIDALIILSNKSTLPVDEKTDRPIYRKSPNIALEIVANPNSKYQTDGWAYHRGRFICYGSSNEHEAGLEREPLFFFIDEDFINTFNRNPEYTARPVNKQTNGLYRSIIKLVPRVDILAYIKGEKLPLKPKSEKKIEGVKAKHMRLEEFL